MMVVPFSSSSFWQHNRLDYIVKVTETLFEYPAVQSGRTSRYRFDSTKEERAGRLKNKTATFFSTE
jgi:hypothetical protein